MLVVSIKDLVVEARHGVHPNEKEQAQRFIFNVEVTLDSRANISDDLTDTLNYTELKQIILKTAQNNSFNLIERLAQTVAAQILENERVRKVVVAIDKPDVFETGVPGIRLEVTSEASR